MIVGLLAALAASLWRIVSLRRWLKLYDAENRRLTAKHEHLDRLIGSHRLYVLQLQRELETERERVAQMELCAAKSAIPAAEETQPDQDLEWREVISFPKSLWEKSGFSAHVAQLARSLESAFGISLRFDPFADGVVQVWGQRIYVVAPPDPLGDVQTQFELSSNEERLAELLRSALPPHGVMVEVDPRAHHFVFRGVYGVSEVSLPPHVDCFSRLISSLALHGISVEKTFRGERRQRRVFLTFTSPRRDA